MLELEAPEDGRYTGGFTSAIRLTSSSVSAPYNGLSLSIPVSIEEERPVGLTVRSLRLLSLPARYIRLLRLLIRHSRQKPTGPV